MATEIELKAHVKDSEALKILLSKKAEYSGSFEKEDTYWTSDMDLKLPPQGLRLRRETRCFPDGKREQTCIVTRKIKSIKDGIEINDEREFEVKPAEEFEDFLGKIGLEINLTKHKRGWSFYSEGINAELVEVEGLGWFVELEILADSNFADGALADGFHADDKPVDSRPEEKERLLNFLDSLGIEREAIESRFYSEMLKSK